MKSLAQKWFILYKVTIKFGLMLVMPNKVEQGYPANITGEKSNMFRIHSIWLRHNKLAVPLPFVIGPYWVY